MMNSIPSLHRCLLLLFLPVFILFSVLYVTTTPLSILRGISLLNATVSTKHQKCRPVNILDSRPFFEREPPQTHLPRQISTLERASLPSPLRSFRLAFVACARNVEKNVDQFRKHVEPIVDLFHPTSRIIIIESDSSDNTLVKLRQWSRAEVYSYGNVSKILPSRPERIANCRNKLLVEVRKMQADYMVMADADIFATNVSSFLSNFEYNTNDWSVMTANLIRRYYDIWALRTLSDSIMNYDVWHRVSNMVGTHGYCENSTKEKIIYIHQKFLSPERDLLEVRSAFDGAGIYKMEATEGCDYSGDFYTCEHVPFHICMRERNQARIFINPKFTNKWIQKTQ